MRQGVVNMTLTIKDGIPEREKEGTLARINALLFSPELEIPEQKEEKTTSTIRIVKQPLLTNGVAVGVSSPHTLFFSSSDTMKKFHEDYLIENRHKSPELQKAYDRRFGLVLRN